MAKRLVQNTQLATTFTDWDYHQADKDRCQLKKDGSFLFGGYMQIPRLAVSLVMTTSLGVDGEGADAPWKDFEIEKLMYGEDDDPYVFLGALFDPTCEGGGSSAVLTTCEAEDEESALGLGGSPQCISDSKMRVAKNIPALHDTSLAGAFGDFTKVIGPGPALPPAPPLPSPPPPLPGCPRIVTAKRIDTPHPWGMNLQFTCGEQVVEIGNSLSGARTEKKSGAIPLASDACPATVDRSNWLGGHTYGDKFAISVSECQ